VAAADRQPTAVICDDDEMTRQILRTVLERSGYKVLAGVGTALDALNLTLAHHPDVLLLDLVMPGIPGEDIIESIKECCHNTKVIVHTAYDPRFAVKSGARHFVSKGQYRLLEQTLQKLNTSVA
jgi:DNA-binding NarL/FixJ family response regulator